MTLASVCAFAGTQDRGGGDICEDRVKSIRDDIQKWILNDGPAGLKLPDELSKETYALKILLEASRLKIRCVREGDQGYPVMIGKSPKTCIFDRRDEESVVTCDIEKFKATSESDQYVLIHHELAGLAKLERPDGEKSTYGISNQISSFLESRVVKVLAVKKPQGLPPAPKLLMNFKVKFASRSVLEQNLETGRVVVQYSDPQITTAEGKTYSLYGRSNDAGTAEGFCQAAAKQNGVAWMYSGGFESAQTWFSNNIGLRPDNRASAVNTHADPYTDPGYTVISVMWLGNSPADRSVRIASITCKSDKHIFSLN